jgi:hypothetical protein
MSKWDSCVRCITRLKADTGAVIVSICFRKSLEVEGVGQGV